MFFEGRGIRMKTRNCLLASNISWILGLCCLQLTDGPYLHRILNSRQTSQF